MEKPANGGKAIPPESVAQGSNVEPLKDLVEAPVLTATALQPPMDSTPAPAVSVPVSDHLAPVMPTMAPMQVDVVSMPSSNDPAAASAAAGPAPAAMEVTFPTPPPATLLPTLTPVAKSGHTYQGFDAADFETRRSGRARRVVTNYNVDTLAKEQEQQPPSSSDESESDESSDSSDDGRGYRRKAGSSGNTVKRLRAPAKRKPASRGKRASAKKDEAAALAKFGHRTSGRASKQQTVSYTEADTSDEDDLNSDVEPTPRRRGRPSRASQEPVQPHAIGQVLDVRDRELPPVVPVAGAEAAAALLSTSTAESSTLAAAVKPPVVSEYCIKWQDASHAHNTWNTEQELTLLNCKGMKRLSNFQKKVANHQAWLQTCSAEEREQAAVWLEMQRENMDKWTRVERVVAMREATAANLAATEQLAWERSPAQYKAPPHLGQETVTQYLIKWLGLPYEECTWETEGRLSNAQGAIDMFLERNNQQRTAKPQTWDAKAPRSFQRLMSMPSCVGTQTLQLRDYQLEGLNWLAYSWSTNTNGILADEMGLGKTIQCISLLGYLKGVRRVPGPFLVVAPLSTIPAWQREFEKWAPWLNVVVYVGNKNSRDLIRDYEWWHTRKGQRRVKLDVLITTYEFCLKDASHLRGVHWNYLMVDEAHRLKDAKSALYRTLESFHTANRLLVTGTPLQNVLKELWCLLHFLEPEKFDDLDAFEQEYAALDLRDGGDETSQETKQKTLVRLHESLGPHMLRRVKKDVLKSLPSKTERILRVNMSSAQKKYYQYIITHNYRALNKGVKSGKSNLTNIVMELKKCCNHPFLFEVARNSAAEDMKAGKAVVPDNPELDRLIRASGKLILLDKLLLRLKATGHRVLIFSQMVMLLDLLSEYMRLRGFLHQRLDGSMRSVDRQHAMDHFNADDSQDFAFLLSTRAGGLGINLATADTVVIFDSDWNPQNDLQAEARAHRIGQKNHVNIYRLVTKGSVEEEILERARQKMILDHLVIQRMDTSGRLVQQSKKKGKQRTLFDAAELGKILKFGASTLFEDSKEGEEDGDAELVEMDLDDILARAETKNNSDDTGLSSSTESFLSAFRVANYTTSNSVDSGSSSEAKQGDEHKDDPNFWQNLIPEHMVPEDQLREEGEAPMWLGPRQRKQVKSFSEEQAAAQGAYGSDVDDDDDEEESDSEGEGAELGAKEAKQVHRELMHFGTLDRALAHLSTKKRWMKRQKDDVAVRQFGEQLVLACTAALAEDKRLKQEAKQREKQIKQERQDAVGENGGGAEEKQQQKRRGRPPTVWAHFSGAQLSCDVVPRMQQMQHLAGVLSQLADPHSFRLKIKTRALRWPVRWGIKEDSMLLLGVHRYGMSAWDQVLGDPQLGLGKIILQRSRMNSSGSGGVAVAAPAPAFTSVSAPAPAAAATALAPAATALATPAAAAAAAVPAPAALASGGVAAVDGGVAVAAPVAPTVPAAVPVSVSVPVPATSGAVVPAAAPASVVPLPQQQPLTVPPAAPMQVDAGPVVAAMPAAVTAAPVAVAVAAAPAVTSAPVLPPVPAPAPMSNNLVTRMVKNTQLAARAENLMKSLLREHHKKAERAEQARLKAEAKAQASAARAKARREKAAAAKESKLKKKQDKKKRFAKVEGETPEQKAERRRLKREHKQAKRAKKKAKKERREAAAAKASSGKKADGAAAATAAAAAVGAAGAKAEQTAMTDDAPASSSSGATASGDTGGGKKRKAPSSSTAAAGAKRQKATGSDAKKPSSSKQNQAAGKTSSKSKGKGKASGKRTSAGAGKKSTGGKAGVKGGDAEASGAIDKAILEQCKSLLSGSKKQLRTLHELAKSGGLAAKENRKTTKATLLQLGDEITQCLEQLGNNRKVKEHMWYYVSRFAQKGPTWLQKMYSKLSSKAS